MTAAMIPPERVEYITYAVDGSNASEVAAWLGPQWRYSGEGLFERGAGGLVHYQSLRVRGGRTLARRGSGAITAHDAAEVATWGTIPDGPTATRYTGFDPTGTYVGVDVVDVAFPDGSHFETAWVEEK